MKLDDANFTSGPDIPALDEGKSLDSVTAALSGERAVPAFYRSFPVKCLFVIAFLLANLLSFSIVRQGLLTMQTFSHVGWLRDGWFETLLAGLIQTALALFGLMFGDRIRGWSSGLTWTAAAFALLFWGAEFYFGALTQALGSVTPEAMKQTELRAVRLQTEISALGGDIAAEYRRQVKFNRTEAANEDKGIGLSRKRGCFDRCKSFQARAMDLERRFGMLGEPLPQAATGDVNTVLIDAHTRLKLLDERAALLPAFGSLAEATEKDKAFAIRLEKAKSEYAAQTKLLNEHPAITPKALAADYAAGLIKRMARGEFGRIAPHDWVIVFYSMVFIAVVWFLALLLAIYNRNASPTGMKARRAQELHVGETWDREVAEGEARATATEWIAKLRARFWRGMVN